MIHVLSTKILEPHQKELLLNAGISIVEKNFISIKPLDFQLKEIPAHLIFTSKNAVNAILSHPKLSDLQKKEVFAVGDKTTEFLQENGFCVTTTANYGKELADKILAKHRDKKFLFLCGKKRNLDLPEKLRNNTAAFKEVEVYDTFLTPKKIDRTFDGILFFSPSGVLSYCSQNEMTDSVAFCIGTTTASAANKFTEKIIIAVRPSVENVIVQVVNYFK